MERFLTVTDAEEIELEKVAEDRIEPVAGKSSDQYGL